MTKTTATILVISAVVVAAALASMALFQRQVVNWIEEKMNGIKQPIVPEIKQAIKNYSLRDISNEIATGTYNLQD